MRFSCKLVFLAGFFTVFLLEANAKLPTKNSFKEKLSHLETKFNGKIGVYAVDSKTNQILAYRADERFPMQSTLKLMGVAALLKLSESNPSLLQEKIKYTQKDLDSWHPITGIKLNTGMTLEELAAATISYSDNPAINLILKKFGGPKFSTNFARSIDNKTYNLIHYDGAFLNSNPDQEADTVTPKDMAISTQKILLGNVLSPKQRNLLTGWMVNNTTGYKRIRAGVPISWTVADKTGSGSYGIANDVGIIWSPACKPIILAIYTVRNSNKLAAKEDIIADTTALVLEEFAKSNTCFKNGY